MVSYDYDRRGSASGPWAWRPVPVPGGKPGEILRYETRNGRAELRRRSGKEWSLVLDGKEHPIRSKKPQFGHAEHILQQELGRDYARHG